MQRYSVVQRSECDIKNSCFWPFSGYCGILFQTFITRDLVSKTARSNWWRSSDVTQLWWQTPCEVVQAITTMWFHKTSCTEKCNQCQLNWNRIFCNTPWPCRLFVILLYCWTIFWIVWIWFGCNSRNKWCQRFLLWLNQCYPNQTIRIRTSAWFSFAAKNKIKKNYYYYCVDSS